MIADKHTHAAITLLRHPTGGEVTMGAYVLQTGAGVWGPLSREREQISRNYQDITIIQQLKFGGFTQKA